MGVVAVSYCVADLEQQADRLAIRIGQSLRIVAKLLPPIGTGAPGDALQYDPDPVFAGDAGVVLEVATQDRDPGLVLEQVEGREVR